MLRIQGKMAKAAELLFIPGPGMGHLFPALEFGKLLVNRDEHLSIVYLIINLPFKLAVDAKNISDLVGGSSRLSIVEIPPQSEAPLIQEPSSQNPAVVAVQLIETYKPEVRSAVLERITKSMSTVAGVVVDIFCAGMIDVANEFGLPSYIYFTSGAGFLGLVLHAQNLKDEYNEDITEYKDSDVEIFVPSFKNRVPAKVLPSAMLDRNACPAIVLPLARWLRETKGIIVNTFLELENYAIKSLSDHDGKTPRIYPIGPVINHNCTMDDGIISWLDNQPPASVVFLCFGSMGGFSNDQVKEIALALEHFGCRFLWSLRRPPTKEEIDAAGSYANPDEVLPEGFLERTSGVGKVIGWAPQKAVLAHPAVGGFVSHCGWNSILESLWFGVPIAAWPLYAEQQVNAFEMVVELGIAVEIKMDYRNDANMESKIVVTAKQIEKGIKSILMDESKNEMRMKVKDLKEKSQKAKMEDGSSYIFMGHLIDNIMDNIPKVCENQQKGHESKKC